MVIFSITASHMHCFEILDISFVHFCKTDISFVHVCPKRQYSRYEHLIWAKVPKKTSHLQKTLTLITGFEPRHRRRRGLSSCATRKHGASSAASRYVCYSRRAMPVLPGRVQLASDMRQLPNNANNWVCPELLGRGSRRAVAQEL